MIRDKKLKAKAKDSQFRKLTKHFVKKMKEVDNRDEFEAHRDNLSILMENFSNNLSTSKRKNVRDMNEFMTDGVNFNDANEVENLLESKMSFLESDEALMEDYNANYADILKTAEVEDIILTGEVYSQLLTHKFAITRATDSSDYLTLSSYSAVISADRGFLKSGDNVFDNINGYFTSDRVYGEKIADGDGASTTFPAATVAHTPLKPYNYSEGYYVVVEYIAGGSVEYLIESSEGQLFEPTLVTQHGVVNRTTNTITINVGLPVAPDNATEIVAVYSFVLRDHADIATVSFTKSEDKVYIETNKILFKSTLDAEEVIKRTGQNLIAYMESVKQSIIRNNVDIRNLNRIYRAARNTTVVWDKAVPAGISANEHYASLKYAFSDVIGMIAKRRDKNINVKFRAFTSTRVVSFLESLADTGSEIYSIKNNVSERALGLGDAVVSGYAFRNRVETFAAPFLDVANRPSILAEPTQSDNEITIAAVPVGRDSEIRIPAAFVIFELLRFNGNTKDLEKDVTFSSFTSQTGFAVIDDKYFALLVIANM